MTALSTQIAIVAAGPTGLAAAITAAENDMDVMVFEKGAFAGGTANMGMGPFGVESRMQKELMCGPTKEEAFKVMMEHVHWDVDARLVHDYFWKSGETIDWLEDMGVVFDRPTKYYPGAYETWHVVMPEDGGVPGPRAASAMTKVMYNHAVELGVKFYLETTVKSIKKNDDGAVCGIIAEGPNGEEYDVEAKAVMVCCGGFGNNSDMINEYTVHTDGKDMFGFKIPGITGDGLRMVWAVGGGKSHMEMERTLGNEIPNVGEFESRHIIEQPSALFVNSKGYRIIDEEEIKNGAVAANMIFRQPGHCIFMIIDDSILKHFRRNGVDMGSSVFRGDMTKQFLGEVEEAAEKYPDTVFIADSLEELAEKMGVDEDTFLETVEDYNDSCDCGWDDLFLKNHKYLHPIVGKRFYAMKMLSGAYGSVGGIKVNHKLEVITDDFEVIPGLYAGGSDVCDLYKGTYCYLLGGNTMGFAVNSGRIAAENMVDYVEELED